MHRRWLILALLFLSLTLNLLDRQVLSIVAPVLRDQFGFTNTQYGTIVFWFLLGMAAGQIPAGLLLDRFGPRAGFPILVSAWSLASLAHAFAGSLRQFAVYRFLLGLSECGAYSGGIKVIGQWFPARERALAGGIFNSGSLVGSVVAAPLIVWLLQHYGWRGAFLLPSLAGFVWIVPWLLLYRAPAAQPARLSLHAIGALLHNPAVWGVIAMRALGGPVSHFYWYWLPEYLRRDRGFSLEQIGLYAWLPFFFGGLGNIAGGWFSSALIARGWSADRARKAASLGSTALCLCALGVPFAPNAAIAIALISAAYAGISAYSATLIGILTDLFPQNVLAQVSALTGIGDNATGMFFMLATGFLIDHFSYLPVFTAVGLLPALGLVALYGLVGTIRPHAVDGDRRA